MGRTAYALHHRSTASLRGNKAFWGERSRSKPRLFKRRLHRARRTARRWLMLAVAGAAVGCSFLELDEFDGPPCRLDADCERATLSQGHDPKLCKAFVCNQDSGYCEPALAAGEELLDGEDNDCDGWIDEDAALVPPQANGQAATNVPRQVLYASTERQTYIAAVYDAGNGNGDGWVLNETGPDAAHAFSYASEEEQNRPPLNLSQAAMTAAGGGLVFVTVSTLGCGSGIVHIGLSERTSDPFRVWLGGPGGGGATDPNLLYCGIGERGIGLGPETDCQDRACDTRGASQPAIAAIAADAEPLQALATWLAHPSDPNAACGETSAPLLGLGAFSTENDWLNATDLGVPKALGVTSSLTAPAVLPGDSTAGIGNYLLAFACSEPSGVCLSQVEVESKVRGETRATHENLIASDEPASHVTAQLADDADPPRLVALAWREGCDENTSLSFATLRWRSSGPGVSQLLKTAISTGKIVGGPHLQFVPTGFTTEPAGGGWLVLWVEDGTDAQALMAARLTSTGDQLIDVRLLASGSIAGAFPLATVDSSVGYGFFSKGKEGAWPLKVGRVVQMLSTEIELSGENR